MLINGKVLKLEARPLRGKSAGLSVKCLAPLCPCQCMITFKTPRGFSSVSADMIEGVFSSLCGKLAKAKESPGKESTQISLT